MAQPRVMSILLRLCCLIAKRRRQNSTCLNISTGRAPSAVPRTFVTAREHEAGLSSGLAQGNDDQRLPGAGSSRLFDLNQLVL